LGASKEIGESFALAGYMKTAPPSWDKTIKQASSPSAFRLSSEGILLGKRGSNLLPGQFMESIRGEPLKLALSKLPVPTEEKPFLISSINKVLPGEEPGGKLSNDVPPPRFSTLLSAGNLSLNSLDGKALAGHMKTVPPFWDKTIKRASSPSAFRLSSEGILLGKRESNLLPGQFMESIRGEPPKLALSKLPVPAEEKPFLISSIFPRSSVSPKKVLLLKRC